MTTNRYATGITITQVGWILRLFLAETGALPSHAQVPSFAALAALGAGLEVTVGQTTRHLTASPRAICYAVAIPASVFLVLLWLVQAPVVAEPVVGPAAILGGAGAILFLPLSAPRIGVAAVVAAIAAVSVLIATVTIARRSRRPT